MLQNAKVRAFTVSELLQENQQRGGVKEFQKKKKNSKEG